MTLKLKCWQTQMKFEGDLSKSIKYNLFSFWNMLKLVISGKVILDNASGVVPYFLAWKWQWVDQPTFANKKNKK